MTPNNKKHTEIKDVKYIVAYRFLEQAMITLERLGTPMANSVYIKLKEGKRELEDIIW